MSWHAMAWVNEQTMPPMAKFVLLQLARRADDETHECWPGQKLLAKDCSMGERTVRRHLAWLEENGYIGRVQRRRENGSRTSDRYRIQYKRPDWPLDVDDSHRPDATPSPANSRTGHRPDWPGIKDQSKKREEPVNADFQIFYKAYPRHKAPGAAEKAFKTAIKICSMADLMEGVRRYKAEIKAQGTPPDKIAYPATWLNAKRWLDEPDVRPKQTAAKKWPMA